MFRIVKERLRKHERPEFVDTCVKCSYRALCWKETTCQESSTAQFMIQYMDHSTSDFRDRVVSCLMRL